MSSILLNRNTIISFQILESNPAIPNPSMQVIFSMEILEFHLKIKPKFLTSIVLTIPNIVIGNLRWHAKYPDGPNPCKPRHIGMLSQVVK